MPLKIKHLKNIKRGTEVVYATVPIDEARNLRSEEVMKYLSDVYGSQISNKGRLEGKDSGIFAKNISIEKAITEFAEDQNSKEAFFHTQDNGEKEVTFLGEKYKVLGKADYLTFKKIGKRVLVIPAPFSHDITGKVWGIEGPNIKIGESYNHLIAMLNEGFKEAGGNTNSHKLKHQSRRYPQTGYAVPSEKMGITRGDSYSMTLFQEEGYTGNFEQTSEREKEIANASMYHVVEKARPEQILSLYISLSKNISEEEKEKKMKFYKRELKKYNLPIRFFIHADSSNHDKRIFPKRQDLTSLLSSVIAVAGIISGIFFLSSNLTGNVIGNLTNSTSNFIGVGLLILGLVAGFFWIKRKK